METTVNYYKQRCEILKDMLKGKSTQISFLQGVAKEQAEQLAEALQHIAKQDALITQLQNDIEHYYHGMMTFMSLNENLIKHREEDKNAPEKS